VWFKPSCLSFLLWASFSFASCIGSASATVAIAIALAVAIDRCCFA
jgi:hypothetical protein